MAATQSSSLPLAFGPGRGLAGRQGNDAARPAIPANVCALLGTWHVIAASRGSISRNPQRVTETFELSGTRLESALQFERLSGSVPAIRRRIFDVSPAGSGSLWDLLQTSLEIVFVDESQAIVAEGRRLRILSRTPEISPRDFFRRVSLMREKGHNADDLRMIPVR